MINAKRFARGVAAISLIFALASRGQAKAVQNAKPVDGGVERQIDMLTDQMAKAQLSGDTEVYAKYYADDAIIVHSIGTLSTKAEEIFNLESGTLKYEAYDVHDKIIHTYGDTVVVELVASTRGVIKGKPFSGDFRVTRVWVKQKGDWRVVLFQTAKVVPQSP